jgi:ABC-type branched-subunit amino acid transport system ATPase component
VWSADPRARARRSTDAHPILSCERLSKIYRMGEVDVRALDGVDFRLHEGELLVLLGPSGSGKSTLLNILGGLDVPTSGRVLFAGEDLTAADEEALTRYRRRHVGFVFQFYNLVPSLTARENVALVTDIADDPLEPEEALGLVEEQRVNVIAVFSDPRQEWAALGDGFRIEARLVLWRGEDVLKVPQGAAFRRGDGWAVFRVVSGKARLTPVEIGHRGETEVEVLSGLDPGAVVVVHPGDRVEDGASVEALD